MARNPGGVLSSTAVNTTPAATTGTTQLHTETNTVMRLCRTAFGAFRVRRVP